MRLAALILAAGLPPAALAQPDLRFPVDCDLGRTCFLQNLVDRDPGPQARDLTCGMASYDDHTGIDIRLATRAEVDAGIAVLAAAPGTVRATRDGMADRRLNETPDVRNRECGNGVVIDHAEGWSTQYCHLRMGSVAVRPGERVEAGQRIGLIGLSGNTEFPHLHLTLRQGDRVIDPLDGRSIDTPCGGTPSPLVDLPPGWTAGPQIMLTGFADAIPDYSDIQTDPPRPQITRDSAALVVWVHAINLSEGDRIVLSLTGPDGGAIVADTHAMPRNRATQFRAAGRKRPAEGWTPGPYSGTVEIRRGEAVIATAPLVARID